MKKSQLKQIIREVVEDISNNNIQKKKDLINQADKLIRKLEVYHWKKYDIPIPTEKERKIQREKLKREIVNNPKYNRPVSREALLKEIMV